MRASRESVRNGNMLSEPLSHAKVFPPMVVRMIAIGERSGALEQLLEKIAEFYDSQVEAMIKSMTSLIEPLLICFMGGIVGVVILSVFLPILNLIGNLSGSLSSARDVGKASRRSAARPFLPAQRIVQAAQKTGAASSRSWKGRVDKHGRCDRMGGASPSGERSRAAEIGRLATGLRPLLGQ